MEQELWVTMSDGQEVYVKRWANGDEAPIAIVQLAHGMAEHINRYQEFAEFLLSERIFVYGSDHRGHGHTGERSGLFGFFAEDGGFERAVDDLKEINGLIHRQYPETPVFLMGHSMGSFLARRFVQRFHGVVDGVILSGTGGNPGLLGKIGKLIARAQIRKMGLRTPSPLMNKLTFGSYLKGLGPVQTKFDWLTRDPIEVRKYIDDPYCGFVSTSGFYYDLLSGLETIHKKEEVDRIEKDLPFFFFSGTMDPVGKWGDGVREVIRKYKQHGIRFVDYILYPEGRHEMLNEINREDVMKNVVRWIQRQLGEGRI